MSIEWRKNEQPFTLLTSSQFQWFTRWTASKLSNVLNKEQYCKRKKNKNDRDKTIVANFVIHRWVKKYSNYKLENYMSL